MTREPLSNEHDPLCDELIPETGYQFELDRRDFMKMLGAGILITVSGDVFAQRDGGRRGGRGGQRGGGSQNVAARLHVGQDGVITVMTGKVEEGQGSRGEITQAAAEELRVPVSRINLVMADTSVVPDDGLTAGSRTTPGTIPPVRRAAAAARELLVEMACATWGLKPDAVQVQDGTITDPASGRKLTYAELAGSKDAAAAFARNIPQDVAVTPVAQWKVMGTSVPRPNLADIVTGKHQYPSDIRRPGMLYGKVLRAPSFGAKLASIDLAPAQAMKDVVVVRDGDFVGCAAPTSFKAAQAVEAVGQTAKWEPGPPQPSNKTLFAHLKEHARPARKDEAVEQALAGAGKKISAAYEIAYIQHTPMEPRAAVAEWKDGSVTAWVGTDNPFGVKGELARAFSLSPDRVRVIVPDMGGGFGGKHTGEAALEAARLAKAAGRPVSVRWTRQEEFTWAYSRPAGLVELQAALDDKGAITAWSHLNINSGGPGIDAPYKTAHKLCQSVGSDSPLRSGSYRCLATTGNNFARESFIDELAAAAGADPLAFRLANLDNDRIHAVLEAAAKKFGWEERKGKKEKDVGIGMACGTEKGSVVAACVEVAVNRAEGKIEVRRVVEAFECGAILNPANIRKQVLGCIIMGLGGALTEEMLFENGKLLNASLGEYQVPRFKDVPPIELVFLERPDLDLTGAGETPIIAIAPAIANAVCNATGLRIRSMPIRLPESRQG